MGENITRYCEEHGIYEVYKIKGNTIVYYSWYGDDPYHPFIKVTHNLNTGKETRERLRYRNVPKFLIGERGVRYNYYCG